MKKYIILLFAVMAQTFMISCNNDDEPEASIKQKLVGIWKTSMSSSNWRVIELKSDGSIHYALWLNDNGEIWCYGSKRVDAHWSYNENDQTISMYSDDGYYTYTYKVNMSDDGKSWAGYTISKGSTVSFTRLEGEVHIGPEYYNISSQ